MADPRLTQYRFKQALLLLGWGVAAGFVFHRMVDVFAEYFGALFGHYLSPQYPEQAALIALLVVSAAISAGYTIIKRRKASGPSPAETADPGAEKNDDLASPSGLEVIVATGLCGAAAGLLLADHPFDRLGALYGHYFWPAHPAIAALAVLIAAAGVVLASVAVIGRRQASSPAGKKVRPPLPPEVLRDPLVRRLQEVFWWYLLTLGIALAIGVVDAIWEGFARAWETFRPWPAVLTGIAAMWAFAYPLYRVRRPEEWRGFRVLLREMGETLVAALVLCVITGWLVEENYEGFLASSEIFSLVSPATRVAFFVMPAVFFAFIVIMLLCYAYAGHRIRVFVFFHNSREATAAELEQFLGSRGLIVRRIPFRGDYQHDSLLSAIQDEIRRCDAMVCIPGAKPSFVENEVLVASALRKFIVFLVGKDEPRLPNTAYYGYPVFRLERVRRYKYVPVGELILLVAGNWRASIRYFLDSWTRLFDDGKTFLWVVAVFVGGTYLVGGGYALATVGGAAAWQFAAGFHGAYLDTLGNWTPLWIWLNLFLVGCVFALINQLHTRRVLRQEFSPVT